MASLREQAIAAIVTELNTSRPGTVGEFRRDRPDPTSLGSLGEIGLGNVCIAPITQPQETSEIYGGKAGGPILLKTLLVATEYLAVGATSECLEAGLIWTQSVLADTRLGGIVHRVELRATAWERKQADADYWKATRVWAVVFHTARANEEAAS